MRWCVLFLGILCIFPDFSYADKKREQLKERIKELKHDLHCWSLLQQLYLKKNQIRKLIKIASEAKKYKYIYWRRQLAKLAAFENALIDFHKEDSQNKGLSKKVERTAGRLERNLKERKKVYYDTMNVFEERVKKLLTKKQLEIIENYRPVLFHKPYNRRAKRDILERIRKMPEHKFNRRLPRIKERHAKFMRNKKQKRGLRIPVEKLESFLREIRSLTETEYKQKKMDIIAKYASGSEVMKARRELQRIHKETYGGIGKVGEYLLSDNILVFYKALLKKRKR